MVTAFLHDGGECISSLFQAHTGTVTSELMFSVTALLSSLSLHAESREGDRGGGVYRTALE